VTGRLVIDNSVVMSWCFEDEESDLGERALDLLAEREAVVPAIWPLEAANALVVAERRKRLAPGDSLRFVELLASLPIRVEPDPASRVLGEVLALARSSGLSSYDASYLHLAVRLDLPLATLDASMRAAALELGVELL
jgi:predicted nucleic acid-binding protein